MIAFFANIFGYILNFIYNIVQNYGWSIIIFSILMKLLMLPISINQQKTMKKQAILSEKLKEIKIKYKNNIEKQNQETMELYKTEKVNPFGGCITVIVQIILLFAVFYLVRSPLTYMRKVDNNVIDKYTKIMEQNELTDQKSAYKEIELIREIDNIRNLKSQEVKPEESTEENNSSDENSEKIEVSEIKDEELDSLKINMDFFGLNLAQIPSKNQDWKAYIIPVLYVLVSILSMKIVNSTNPAMNNKKKDDNKENNSEEDFDPMVQMNKNMTFMMPIMYVLVALVAPLGLALYWLMNSLLMIVEKLALNKLFKDEEEEQ